MLVGVLIGLRVSVDRVRGVRGKASAMKASPFLPSFLRLLSRTVLKSLEAVADGHDAGDRHHHVPDHEEVEESGGGAAACAHVVVQLGAIRIHDNQGGLRGWGEGVRWLVGGMVTGWVIWCVEIGRAHV